MIRIMLRHSLLIGTMLLSGSSATGSALNPGAENGQDEKVITALRTENQIVIDGALDEPDWALTEPISDLYQQEPQEGDPASERTEVYLLYDDENLYVGARCFDTSGEEGIVITDMRRDYPPFDNDTFVFVLDTFNDDRNGYLFSTNPRGSKHDSQIANDGGKSNRDWDGIWHVKTKITEWGWLVEIAIPFKTLRFGRDEEQLWGINFQRRIRRKNEASHWSRIPRPYFITRLSDAGKLEGLRGIQSGRNLFVKPYVSAPVVRLRGDDVDFLPDAGFDVKYSLISQLTLDLTVNTDFSQVEADDEQINLTRFSLFFPEKREFFLENAATFLFGPGSVGGLGGAFRDLIPFFSRRIGISAGELVPLLGGARLTGRAGDYTLGLLSLQVGESEQIPSTNYSVFRLRRDVWRKSEIGGILINKQDVEGHFNRTFGADANFTFLDFMNISSFLLKTSSPSIHQKDMAGYIRLNWRDPRWTLRGSHLTIQDNVNPAVGFVPRKGIRKSTGQLAYRSRPGERISSVREFEPLINIDYITDQDNLLETRILEGRLTTRFQNGGSVWSSVQSHFERLTEPFAIRSDQHIPVGDYRFHTWILSLSSDPSRLFSGDVRVTTGDFFDGDRNSFRSTARFQQPGLRAEVSWQHDDVRLPLGSFDTNLLATRVTYSFNPSMFLNALIQYNSDQKEIRSNIRFNIIHKPLSDFFLVYNETRSSTGEILGRALIGKLTYMFSL